MPRALKLTAIVFGSLIGVVLLVLAGILFFIDPNDYKTEIAGLVKDKTDMELVLEDRLEWELWPSLGVKLGTLSLTDPVAKERLVEVHKAAVAVQVMPLLSGQIAIDSVLLDGAKIRFIQHADGSTSWDRLLAKLTSSEEDTESTSVKLAVDTVDIKNTELFYLDAASTTTHHVTHITIGANQVDLDKAFPITAAFNYSLQDSAGQGLITANTIDSHVQVFQDQQRYELKGLSARSEMSGNLLPAPMVIALKGDVIADVKANRHSVDQLALQVDYNDTSLTAPANVTVTGNVVADLANNLVDIAQLAISANYPAANLKTPANVVLSSPKISANLLASEVNAAGIDVKASYHDAQAPAPISATVKTDITANWAKGDVSVPMLAINASIADKSLANPVPVKLDTQLHTNWNTGDISLPALAVSATYTDPAFAKPIPVQLNTAISGNWKQAQAQLSQLVLKALEIEARGHIAASLPAFAEGADATMAATSGMSLTGQLSTNTFNPRTLMNTLKIDVPKTQNPAALNRVSAKADIVGNEQSLLLQNLRITLDDSTLTGSAGINDLKTNRLYARLNLDRINVDHYLPPTQTAKTPAPAAAKDAKAVVEPLLPVELLREQNMDVALSAGALTVMTYPIANFRIAANAQNGQVNITELKGNIYNGSFNVPASINVKGAQPVLSLKPNINQIEIAPILQMFTPQQVFSGKASYNGNLMLTGNTTDAWLQSMDGDSDLKLSDGQLHGINMVQKVLDEMGKYQALLPLITGKDAATIISKQHDTKLRELLAEVTINNGKMFSDGLNADIEKAKVNGSGSFNLFTQDVDYAFNLKLDKSILGEKYAAYPIPLRCKGNLKGNLATICGVDVNAVKDIALKVAANQQLEKLGVKNGDVNAAIEEKKQEAVTQAQEKMAEEKQKAQEKLNEKLNEGLNKLFNR